MSGFEPQLRHASLGFILLGLAITGIGLPFPETMFIVAAGVVSQQNGLPVALPILTSCLAVLLGDLALFLLARQLGPFALRHRPLLWLLPASTRPRIEALFARHGAMAVFVARHVSGLRAATFVLAGTHRMRTPEFVLWDSLAIVVSVPWFALLGFFFSSRLDHLRIHIGQAQRTIGGLVALGVVGYWMLLWVRTRRRSTRTSPTEVQKNR